LLPHELVSKYVVPYLRALVAAELTSLGVSQGRVSKLLGVTQPMVRKYINEGRDKLFSRLEEAGISREEIEAAVKVLADIGLKRGRVEYYKTFSQLVNSFLSRCVLCDLHRRLDPEIPATCDLCRKLFPQQVDPYIEDARNALRVLQSFSNAYRLIPEVGMNIVVAPPGAERPEEVVGFVGRIIRVGTKVVAVGEPVYGGSRHTATVLLIVRRRWPQLRSAIVIRFEEEYLQKLSCMGYKLVFSGPHRSRSELMKDIANSISRYHSVPGALVDRGGVGIEPVIYIFDKTATSATEKALKLIS